MQHHNDIRRTANTSPIRRFWQRRAYVLAATTLLAVTACGSSSTSSADKNDGKANGVASADDVENGDSGADSTDGSTDGSADDSTEAEDPNQVFADWEQCMKDEGVDTSAFGGDEQGGNSVGGESSETEFTLPPDFDWDAFEAASEVCDPIMDDFDPFAGLTPEQKALAEDYLVTIENCMKDKGFDIPMGIGGGNGLGDEEDDTDFSAYEDYDPDELDQAFLDCEKENPVPDELAELEG